MKLKNIKVLENKKNLLAFSAGVDSSALFFLLLEHNVEFDLAFVNYQTREQSNTEMEHATNLAKKFGKEIYILKCKLNHSNFEHEARKVRYDFFKSIIKKHKYDNLLLAHQLNDRFEWLMMQVCRGAGASELVGFKEEEKRDGYTLVRPIFDKQRSDILAYLEKNNLPFFVDKSNEDVKYKRNEFRQICNPLVEKYAKGISKSLDFLAHDAKVLDGEFYKIEKELFIYKLQDKHINMRLIDKAVKRLGFVMSEKTRHEALQKNAVINRAISVGRNDEYGFISPFCKTVMTKKFKEKCRIAKIPLHIRAYMFKENLSVDLVD